MPTLKCELSAAYEAFSLWELTAARSVSAESPSTAESAVQTNLPSRYQAWKVLCPYWALTQRSSAELEHPDSARARSVQQLAKERLCNIPLKWRERSGHKRLLSTLSTLTTT